MGENSALSIGYTKIEPDSFSYMKKKRIDRQKKVNFRVFLCVHLSFLKCRTTSKRQAVVFALFYFFCDRNKHLQQTSGQGFVHVSHRKNGRTDGRTDRACSDLCDNIKVLYKSVIDTKQCL